MYEPNGFSETIFKQRYAITPNETWKEACERVAKHIGAAENGNREKWIGRFSEMLEDNLFIPGGRICRYFCFSVSTFIAN